MDDTVALVVMVGAALGSIEVDDSLEASVVFALLEPIEILARSMVSKVGVFLISNKVDDP